MPHAQFLPSGSLGDILDPRKPLRKPRRDVRERQLKSILENPKEGVFVQHLSEDQLSSYRLLNEWWAARCDDAVFQANARAAAEPDNGQTWPFHYFRSLEKLFQTELDVSKSTKMGKNHTLGDVRQTAAVAAACQRIAFTAAAHCAEIPSPLSGDTTALARATVNPGFWIQSRKDRASPGYLWDTQEKKQIKINETDSTPAYAVISHTWGEHINPNEEWVQLPGVDWKIPCIDKFEVEQLPDLLQQLGQKNGWRYAWLDLLTIPQGPTTREGEEQQQREIKKQASIFFGASEAIAWYNDVRGWDVLPQALRYLGLNLLVHSRYLVNGSAEMAKLKTSIDSFRREELAQQSELMAWSSPGSGDRKMQPNQPNGWFTSPWTLQESCARPDMLLADANFNILTLAPRHLVRLNDIAALVAAAEPSELGCAGHRSIEELFEIFRESGLAHLVSPNSLRIVPRGSGGVSGDHAKLEIGQPNGSDYFNQAFASNRQLEKKKSVQNHTSASGEAGYS